MTKEEEKVDYIDAIEIIEREVFDIYDDIIDRKEFSSVYLTNISNKLGELESLMWNLKDELEDRRQNTIDICFNKEDLALFIPGTILTIINPLLGIIALIIILIRFIKNLMLNTSINRVYLLNNLEIVKRTITTLTNTLETCHRFIDNKLLPNQISIPQNTVKILTNYINSGFYDDSDPQINEMITKIIQTDLCTEETDLQTLLELYRNKITNNNVNRILKLEPITA